MARSLDVVFSPYVNADLPARFADAPPAVVREALTCVDSASIHSRPNMQPPAAWLLDRAEQYGGLLGGGFAVDPWNAVRVDALCVGRERAAALAIDVRDSFPALDEWPSAFELALAEGWTDWTSTRSSWEGPCSALLGDLPDLPVFGLWWD